MLQVRRFAKGLLVGIAYSASAGGIATVTGAIPNYFLAAESVLSGRVSWLAWFQFAFPISLVTGFLARVGSDLGARSGYVLGASSVESPHEVDGGSDN